VAGSHLTGLEDIADTPLSPPDEIADTPLSPPGDIADTPLSPPSESVAQPAARPAASGCYIYGLFCTRVVMPHRVVSSCGLAAGLGLVHHRAAVQRFNAPDGACLQDSYCLHPACTEAALGKL